MKYINQNLKKLKNASEAWNLKNLQNTSKVQNLKMLAFIAIAALGLMFSACNIFSNNAANTNPLTDKSKHKYHPQNRDELVELLNDESIKLDTIDTSKITDMSLLFADTSSYRCDKLLKIGLKSYMRKCENTADERKDFSGIETWDVSNVIDMSAMFYEAHSFNQPLDSWDVSKVKI
ncbi:hypothetical protein BKN38_06305 [Helicobacter sp. CLO-3]|uniref:BspA family leucine-rich repeat surface protein n=1 Tax=unclassified Helicobacter TaxID=2593540 RepID=UPI0008055769|nr:MULTISPECIES: BspA family leucine-rich repeat surface protein [unclassified Helicobacter]OBV28716.1 hypothetical protein BA723_08380 [Helicobacter sp. CLO-3]OHU82815.1 hypothetical protein BKN38_06305 [Helicobacter sp. CLO-3]